MTMTSSAVLRRLSWLSWCCCAAACLEAPASPPGGDVGLDSLFTVVLEENDTAFTGRPNGLGVDPGTGDFLVSDGYGDQVLRFDRGGQLRRVYGARGQGPGEFQNAGRVVAVLGDRIVAADDGRSLLNVFEGGTGEFSEAVPFRGILGSLAPDAQHAGVVWLGVLGTTDGISLARWVTATGDIEYGGWVPAEYQRSNALSGIFNRTFVVPWNGRLVVAFQGDSRLFVQDPGGDAVDTLFIPSRLRRPYPDDVVSAMGGGRPFPELFATLAPVFGLYVTPLGHVLVVHFDQEIEGPTIEAKVYLSIVDPVREEACIDIPVPVESDVQPRLATRADTLFAITQRVRDGHGTTLVTAYQVPPTTCGSRLPRR